MNPLSFKKHPGRFFFSLVSILGLTCFALSQGPNIELHFLREVPSKMTPEHLDRNISSVSRWPQWFFSLSEAVIVGQEGKTITPGAQIKLMIDPQKGKSNRFEVMAEVLQYSPNHELILKILTDSSGRLTHLFDSIIWKLEFIPEPSGTLLRGTATAITRHWKSRFFGRIAERILMNQIFYWDLIQLSELTQPFSSGKNPNPPRSNSSFSD